MNMKPDAWTTCIYRVIWDYMESCLNAFFKWIMAHNISMLWLNQVVVGSRKSLLELVKNLFFSCTWALLHFINTPIFATTSLKKMLWVVIFNVREGTSQIQPRLKYLFLFSLNKESHRLWYILHCPSEIHHLMLEAKKWVLSIISKGN